MIGVNIGVLYDRYKHKGYMIDVLYDMCKHICAL